MLRTWSAAVIAFSLALAPPVSAATAHKKHPVVRHHIVRKHPRYRHHYILPPGYRPPWVIARERAARYWARGPRYYYYGPAWPRFYRGRWNGGGFGPCYIYTPIGYMWTCGK